MVGRLTTLALVVGYACYRLLHVGARATALVLGRGVSLLATTVALGLVVVIYRLSEMRRKLRPS